MTGGKTRGQTTKRANGFLRSPRHITRNKSKPPHNKKCREVHQDLKLSSFAGVAVYFDPPGKSDPLGTLNPGKVDPLWVICTPAIYSKELRFSLLLP